MNFQDKSIAFAWRTVLRQRLERARGDEVVVIQAKRDLQIMRKHLRDGNHRH